MTDQQIIIAVAKLDGLKLKSIGLNGPMAWWENDKAICYEGQLERFKPFLTSRDAIIPVIEKQSEEIQAHVWFWIVSEYIPQLRSLNDVLAINLLPAIMRKATPKQISIALVKATGNYIES